MYEIQSTLYTPPIEIFVRHCYYSEVSAHKGRFPAFSHQKCHENLMDTIDFEEANITFFLDTYHRNKTKEDHFILKEKRGKIVSFSAGTETGSFLSLIDYVLGLCLPEETIVYFLEDDYLHRPNWVSVLREGFCLPDVDYLTLFDHGDKYGSSFKEPSFLFHTTSCHWRSTISTTNTYAMRIKTLKKDRNIHEEYSKGRRISADHEKFCKLRSEGRLLISSLPGWSTHVDPPHVSPCFDWPSLLRLGAIKGA